MHISKIQKKVLKNFKIFKDIDNLYKFYVYKYNKTE